MREFNLEEAKAGAKVCTRDGRQVKVITFNNGNNFIPIYATFDGVNGVLSYHKNGRYFEFCEEDWDLMMED